MNLDRLVFGRQPQAILKQLYLMNGNSKIYASKLARLSDTTYSHTVKVIKLFSEQGIVDVDEKIGRERHLKITDKGRKIIIRVIEIEDIIKDTGLTK